MAQRILVVDDDKQIVRLVRSYLEQANFEVLTAYDGESALHAVRRERPDLVVLDLMLPERDGQEVTRIMRREEALADIPIIMLTAKVEDIDKIIGLELGADDYITKPFNPREVVARVRAILRRVGGSAPQAATLRVGSLLMDIERHEARQDDRPLELTPTEFDLLRVLMESPGRAFTRLELVEKALGYNYVGLERTLDSHIRNLRKKIEADPANPRLIHTVYGVGYRLEEER